MVEVGFGREDITPRVGGELGGFRPFCHRYATWIRDRLWARAMGTVPMILGHRPYAGIHDELADALLTLERTVHERSDFT